MNNKSMFLILAGIVVVGGALYFFSKQKDEPRGQCETKMEKFVIDQNDEDMQTLIKPGEEVQVEMGYYDCNNPKKDDLVLVKTSGRPEPIVRVVKVLPNDEFKIEKQKDKYNLQINGDWMENLSGDEYALVESKVTMLKLYEKTLKSKMDAGAYFIFSNRTTAGYDSTRFGPIEKSQFLGKVVYNAKSDEQRVYPKDDTESSPAPAKKEDTDSSTEEATPTKVSNETVKPVNAPVQKPNIKVDLKKSAPVKNQPAKKVTK